MKLSDCIKYSWLKAKRNRKNIFILIVSILGYLIISGALTYRNYVKENVNNIINKDLGYRSIVANLEFDSDFSEDEEYSPKYKKILDLEHVLEIYNFDYYTFASPVKEYENGLIGFLYGSENTLPKNVIGERFTSKDTGVAICPLKFYPYYDDDYNKVGNYIDGNEVLGTSLSVEVPIYTKINGRIKLTETSYSKQYKIVGLYDAEQAHENYNSCYISRKDIKELYDTTNREANGGNEYSTVLVLVDDLKNVDEVLEKLSEMGFLVEVQSYIKYDFVDKVCLTCDFVVFTSCIGVLILTILFIKKINVDNLNNTGIKKAIGFTNKHVQLTNLCQSTLLSLISCMIGLVLYFILFNFVEIYYKNYFFYHLYTLDSSMSSYLEGMIVIVAMPIIVTYCFTSLDNKKNIMKLLRVKRK